MIFTDLYKVIHGEIWRLITTHLVFRNPAQLIVGLMVLYSLRGFERQMGSKKFGAYLIYCLLASTVLSILFILILDVLMGLSFVPSSGPFFLIYSLMIFYYCEYSICRSKCTTRSIMDSPTLYSLLTRACPCPVSDPLLRPGAAAVREELDLPTGRTTTFL